MTFVTVWVNKPETRLIYINGDYMDPAGDSSTDSFTVSSGGHLFETLTDDRQVDNRKKVRIKPTDHERVIELDPVDPPEPI